MRLRLTDVRDQSVRELDLTPVARDMPGWQNGVAGWSIGSKGSGSPIEIDEPLGECQVGIFSVGFQLLLWGVAKELPNVWLFPQSIRTNNLLPLETERWLLADREDLKRVAMGGDVRLRIDLSPIRVGNTIIECLQTAETPEGCCALCNAPLQLYFRVGSQQVCPACTEKFKQETRVHLAQNYRRALRYGIAAAIASGVIHAVLITTVHVSFGSIFIGVFVGLAMRIASKETAGTRYQVTAVLLTLPAGFLPCLLLRNGTSMSVLYLAIGIFAAWKVTARHIPTAIQGPFQLKEFGGRGN